MYTTTPINNALRRLGVPELRPWQQAPMQAILSGNDVFTSAPTGGGKSILFQAPAVMEGTTLTIVITLTRSLQVDQVIQLKAKGVRAEILNSDLSKPERQAILEHLPNTSLLYLAPEQLHNRDLREALARCHVKRLVVDEAHILPEARLGFRKAYG